MPENDEARIADIEFTVDNVEWTNVLRPVTGTTAWLDGYIAPADTIGTLDDTVSERLKKLEEQFEEFSMRLFNLEQKINSVDDDELMAVVDQRENPFAEIILNHLKGAT